MKITEENQNVMKLERKVINSYIFGGVLAIIGILLILEVFVLLQELLYNMLVGGGVIVLGLVIILVSKNTYLSLDKTSGKMVLERKSILKNDYQEAPLNQAKSIEMIVNANTSSARTGNRRNINYNCSLQLVFQNGASLELYNFSYSPSNMRVGGVSMSGLGGFSLPTKHKELAGKIATFIGVPYVEHKPPTIGEAITAVKDAIVQGMQGNQQTPPNNNFQNQQFGTNQTPPRNTGNNTGPGRF